MDGVLVESRAGLEALVDQARTVDRIAIDLEGDGFFRYRARVCTLQMQVGDTLAVVDTLACWEPELLQWLLGADGPQKVLHDAAFDARLLWDQGVVLDNVFDTAMAARLLGEPATGLASMLAKRCDVQIDKDLQQADWGQRPFDQQALRYLFDDVRYLLALQDSLAADVAAIGIGPELHVECDYMLRQARQPTPPPRPPWLRIKGARRLPPIERAVLRELSALRERLAQEWDLAPFRVTHDRVLLELARRRPRDMQSLRAVRSLFKGRAKEVTQAFLAAVARGVEAGDVPQTELDEDRSGPSSEERARRKRVERALVTWRAHEAERRGVDPQVVLPGHGLQDLAKRTPVDAVALDTIDGLGEVRLARYRDHWLSLIAGANEAPPVSGR